MKTIIGIVALMSFVAPVFLSVSCGSPARHLYESVNEIPRELVMAQYRKMRSSNHDSDDRLAPILAQEASVDAENQEKTATGTIPSKKTTPYIAPDYGVPPPYLPGFPYFCDPFYYPPSIVLAIHECKAFYPQIYSVMGARVAELELSREVIDNWYLTHLPYDLFGWQAQLFSSQWP
ncbi:MAG TPA: hypothetical protein VEL47_03730 [Myxococcota bacterium]|nr:hypothetical protein [Myxococcota bacterium]